METPFLLRVPQYPAHVSEGLNSVETLFPFRRVRVVVIVSEGLNSVETAEILTHLTAKVEFQKDLIVWKP